MAARKHNAQFTLNAPRQTPLPAHPFAPVTPASAVAARIFNDPQSWMRARDDPLDQFPAVPTSSGPDSAEPFTGRFRFAPRVPLDGTKGEDKGNNKATGAPPFITFNLGLDPAKDAEKGPATGGIRHLSMVWTHHRKLFPPLSSPRLSPLPLPPASAGLLSTTLPPNSAAFTGMRSVTNSATWGILEYYGVVLPETPATADAKRVLVRPPVRSSSRGVKVPTQPAAPPLPLPQVPEMPPTTPLKVKNKTVGKAKVGKAAAPAVTPAPPASRAAAPTTTKQASSAPAPAPAPPARVTSVIRPLPVIPNQQPQKQQQEPKVPTLAPPAEWSRPRARASTTPSNARSLPRTPGQVLGHSHSRSESHATPGAGASAIKRRPRVAPPF
ncbi:hypothetical protein C8R46DRAFT_1211281 [Mycena filopes]|nr:hypothetical protein C8R46DRAFT_1211281 [Mycena filopes]